MSTKIDSLELEIKSDIASVKDQLNSLIDKFNELKKSIGDVGGSEGEIKKVTKELKQLKATFKTSVGDVGTTKFRFNMSDIFKAQKELDTLNEKRKQLEEKKDFYSDNGARVDSTVMQNIAFQLEKIDKKSEEVREKLKELGVEAGKEIQVRPETGMSISESMGLPEAMEDAKISKQLFGSIFSKFKVPTEQFKSIGTQMQKINAEYVKTMATIEKNFQSYGDNYGATDQFRGQIAKIQELQSAYYKLRTERAKMLYSFNLSDAFTTNTVAIEKLKKSIIGTISTVGSFSKKLLSIGRNIGKVSIGVLNTVSPLRSLKDRLGGLVGIANNVGTSFSRMSKMFSLMLKRMALRGVIDGVKTGMNNLAHYCNTTRASMNSLINGLAQLKNAFAVAVAPIWNVVAPALSYLISMLSSVLNAIGRFFSALTGGRTSVQAIKVNTDNYAKSLGSVGSSAGDAADSVKDLADAQKEALSVLGFDELNQLTAQNDSSSGGSGSGGSGGSGGLGDIDYGSMFETVDIEKEISDFANSIRKAIKNEDWEGLGYIIASGMNKGLQKIYDAISWNNCGKKIEAFSNAIVRTFNSIVKYFDWNLLGRTIGTGVNTMVNTASIYVSGINWGQLGSKIAESVNGLFDEVDWEKLGDTFGNSLMIIYRIGKDFAINTNWESIGQSVADAINGFFGGYSFSEIGTTLSLFINGLKTSLFTIAQKTDWKGIVDNVTSGIGKFLSDTDWSGVGNVVVTFVSNLANSISDKISSVSWTAVGHRIADELMDIEWGTLLKSVAKFVWETFKGLLVASITSIGDIITEGLFGSELEKSGQLSMSYYTGGFTGQAQASAQSVSDATKTALSGTDQTAYASESGTKTGGGWLSGLKNFFFGNVQPEVVNCGSVAINSLTTGVVPLAETGGLTTGESYATGITTGLQNADVETGVKGISDSLLSGVDNSVAEFENSGKKLGLNSVKGISGQVSSGTKDVTSAVDSVGKSMEKTLSGYTDKLGKVGQANMKAYTDAVGKTESTAVSKVTSIANKMVSTLNNYKSRFSSVGSSLGTSFYNGFSGRSATITNSASNIASSMISALDSDSVHDAMYNAGVNAGKYFAEGIKAVNIPTPHLEISSYTNTKQGNTTVSTPNYKVNWYATGGLFTKATLVSGLGEAGDEAVLPLENRRTMSRIAGAITDRMSGMFDPDAIMEAVSDGVVMALAGNSENLFNPNLYVTVKTENDEVLARAVQRGQRSINYRMNVRG